MILTAEQYKAYRRNPNDYPETLDPECQEIANLMVGLCDDGWWCGWMDGIVEILFDYLTHPDKELPDGLHVPEDGWRRDLESLRVLTLEKGRWVHEDDEGTVFIIPAPAPYADRTPCEQKAH